ncbi:DMT family transporter [Marivita sp. GX14005]|uniref:DMT family transporter n=1 Tax=Marivita sp. GX14005 TaxID=2942276 RepID=UPI0020191DEF|nr:DMT family transporter [Marivita sp. GX14005]MCL3883245.1 DMT family transporter [Marivita sp. GX14005]
MMMHTDIRSAPWAVLQERSGMIFMALAMLLLPVGDTFAKLLTGAMDPVAVAMWRLIAQSLCLLPVAFVLRRQLRGPMFSPVVALSGALLSVSLTGLIFAFSVMPIATAIAIFFVEPLILTVLAGPLLGEKAGPRRLIAVGVGLIGALIVIRPGGSAYGWATLLPLMSAFAYALNMIVLKRGSARRSALTMQCGATVYAALFVCFGAGALALAGDLLLLPAEGQGHAWAIIAALGAVAAFSFVLIAEAFRREEATVLAPFQYFEILAATALGFFVFGDFPDAFTWAGLAVILGSGIYIFQREQVTETSAPRRKRGGR